MTTPPPGTRAHEYHLRRAARETEAQKNSRDGVLWYEAKIPPRFHICRVHTDGFTRTSYVQRCACGAIRNPLISRRWLERNTRQRTKR